MDQFKNNFPASQITRSWDVGNGNVWYYFIEEIFEGEPVGFSICFAPDSYLCHICFKPDINILQDDHELSNGDWPSLKQQEWKREYYDKWLLRKCGPRELTIKYKLSGKYNTGKLKTDYKWGKIAAYFDQKSWNCDISLRYK